MIPAPVATPRPALFKRKAKTMLSSTGTASGIVSIGMNARSLTGVPASLRSMNQLPSTPLSGPVI
jgi:hypothetical protein